MDIQAPFAKGSSYPVRGASSVRYFVDGEESFSAIADAIEGAKLTVYITAAYASLNFRFKPPDGEQLLDLLGRVAARGVTVAVLFWQPQTSVLDTVSPSARAQLEAKKVLARWDLAKAPGIYSSLPIGCHHQKTVVVDGELAFVGGLNMVQAYWDAPTHVPDDDRRVTYDVVDVDKRKGLATSPVTLPYHDTFACFDGPAVRDVEANFLERWNGATDRAGASDLTPTASPLPAIGPITIQVVRTIPQDAYPHTAAGEQSIKETMLHLIAGARHGIYFENQYFFDDDVTAAIRAAGERGVRVVGLITRKPDAGQGLGVLESVLEDHHESAFQWTQFNPALRRRVQLYTPFTERAPTKDIYIHSKTMIVDDRYVLLGSANMSFTSLDFHSEMCVLADDSRGALALRQRLWSEHLCRPWSPILEDFEFGANEWVNEAVDNRAAIAKGDSPRSRVVSLTPPSLASMPGLEAASGLS